MPSTPILRMLSTAPSGYDPAAVPGVTHHWSPSDTKTLFQLDDEADAAVVGDDVGRIRDRVGSLHLDAPTTGERPTLVDRGGGVLALSANGVNTYMRAALGADIRSGGAEIFALVEVLVPKSFNGIVSEKTVAGSTSSSIELYGGSSGQWTWFVDRDTGSKGGGVNTPSGGLATSGTLLIHVAADTADSEGSRVLTVYDGSVIDTTFIPQDTRAFIPTNTSPLGIFEGFAAGILDGDIIELVFCDGSFADREGMTGHLLQVGGIAA